MHSILITGANGFVGNSLCIHSLLQGYSIRAAIRSKVVPFKNVEIEVIRTIDANTDWSNALAKIDTVIHLAARVHIMNDDALDPLAEFQKINVEGTLNLASQAVKAGVKRFIYVSSIKVNGEFTRENIPFSEKDIPNPQDAYGISKLEAEQGLMQIANQTNMEVVIIRPPLVYGVGVKANFLSMIQLVRRGIPLPFGAVKNKRSFVYLENLVSLIVCCIKHPAAANQLFLVSDGYDLSTPELIVNLAHALGVKPRLIPVQQKIIELTAKVIGKKNLAQRICGNLQVDISKARQLLNWEPPYTVEEGLKKTVTGLTQKVEVS